MSEKTVAARKLAAEKHKDQGYDNGSYLWHLSDVVRTLAKFGYTDEHMECAAWLHDIVEDTDTSIEQIKNEFGDIIADLVYRVTNEEGANRKERHVKTYPKIAASLEATALKLADRIANTEASLANKAGKSFIDMYRKEYKGFREALYKQGTHDAMWEHLDSLLK